MDQNADQTLQQFSNRFSAAITIQRAYLVAMFSRLSQDASKFDAESFIEYLYMLQQNLPDPRSGIEESAGAEELRHLIEMTEDTLHRIRSE